MLIRRRVTLKEVLLQQPLRVAAVAIFLTLVPPAMA
jgi:hypothetical protein